MRAALVRAALGAALGSSLVAEAQAFTADARDTAAGATAPAPEPQDARALLLEAMARVRAGDDAAARPLLVLLLERQPALADHHLNQLAAIDFRAGRRDEAAAWDDRLIGEHPRSVWIGHAVARRAVVAVARQDADAAARVTNARGWARDDPERRALAALADGDLQARSSPRAAFAAYQEARSFTGDGAALARARSEALEQAHPELFRDPDLLIAEAKALVAEERGPLAVARLRAAADAGTPAQRLAAYRALGRALKLQGKTQESIAAWREAAAAVQPPSREVTFDLAIALWNGDHDAEAKPTFERAAADPDHPNRDLARYALGRIAERAGRTDEALTHYRTLGATGTDANLVREARWRVAWVSYERGDRDTADAAFDALAEIERERPTARYWQGRLAERAGDEAGAHARYRQLLDDAPDSYYAELAEGRLGERAAPGPHVVPLAGPPPAAVTGDAYHWPRAVLLRDAGLTAAAARELDAILDAAPGVDRDPAILVAYQQMDDHRAALGLITRLGGAGLPAPTAAAYEYPLAYWPLVSAASREAGIDPYLVLALMRQESLYDPDVRSPAAAYGLMQLLVRTGSRVNGAPVTPGELRDPATNVRLGTRLLRTLLDRYQGDAAHALAAYNAGEEAVAKWDARWPGAPRDEFVERISYRETRGYVRSVLSNHRKYRRLYGEAAPAGASG